MKLSMTHEEIRRDYAAAKDKSAQIGILADLNSCKKNEIREILGLPLLGGHRWRNKDKVASGDKALPLELQKLDTILLKQLSAIGNVARIIIVEFEKEEN